MFNRHCLFMYIVQCMVYIAASEMYTLSMYASRFVCVCFFSVCIGFYFLIKKFRSEIIRI